MKAAGCDGLRRPSTLNRSRILPTLSKLLPPSASTIDIRQVFDSLDKDGSGYVDEQEWRRLTEDTPLAASDDTFLFIERVRHFGEYPSHATDASRVCRTGTF